MFSLTFELDLEGFMNVRYKQLNRKSYMNTVRRKYCLLAIEPDI